MTRASRILIVLQAALIAGLASQAKAFDPNSTKAGAIFLPPDGTVVRDYVYGAGSANVTDRWYVSVLAAGHSYAIHDLSDYISTAGSTCRSALTSKAYLQSDGTTSLAGTLVGSTNPASFTGGSGLCGVAGGDTFVVNSGTNQTVFIHVTANGLLSNEYEYFRIQIQDTTLFCPWFYTDTNYEAYTQVQNTANQNVTFTLTWYAYVATSGGTPSTLGSTTFTLAPNASTYLAAKSFIPAGSYGGARITYVGPPGSITANTTSLNQTGIGTTHSFNIPFTARSLQGLGGNN